MPTGIYARDFELRKIVTQDDERLSVEPKFGRQKLMLMNVLKSWWFPLVALFAVEVVRFGIEQVLAWVVAAAIILWVIVWVIWDGGRGW
jgi:hypothetical protein